MQKIEFLDSKKQWIAYTIFLLCIFSLSTINDFISYKQLTKHKFHTIHNVYVLNQYKKQKKHTKHYVLKLKYKKYVFYTKTNKNIDLRNQTISLTTITNRLKFLSFYKNTFYMPSFNIKIQPSSYKEITNKISEKHSNNFIKEIISAMFLSSYIGYENRQILSSLGISHLIAISGYHISIIYALLFFILSNIYKLLQKNFFAYRNRIYDVSIASFIIIIIYGYFINMPISLLRSIFMLLFGFILFYRHIKLLSMKSLVVVISTLICSNFSLIFSIGFWMSILGVFYIYLFLIYIKKMNIVAIFLIINFALFLAVNPLAHYIFTNTSLASLFSPIVSILFNIFYPLEIVLHLVGYGDLLDIYIISLIDFLKQFKTIQSSINMNFAIFYILMSIASIYHKYFFIFFIFLSICANFYIYKNLL